MASHAIRQIKQQFQSQESLVDQLAELQAAANKLGLYDAADFIRNVVERTQNKVAK